MEVRSAGILLFRYEHRRLEVLLGHPGGPFWADRDAGAWSIPKGLIEDAEDPLAAAKREFQEETGFAVAGDFIELGTLRQPSRKTIYVWALEKDIDETGVVSNTFALEWPKRSGKIQHYPEIDRADWFGLDEARVRIASGQAGFLDRLVEKLLEKQWVAGSGPVSGETPVG